MKLQYVPMAHWPPLAWLARCPHGGDSVAVYHGPGVETTDDWFCEAVWDGAFADGDFDRTDLVFGSGARLRSGVVTFVSAGSTVDRLQSLAADDSLWVSNSLPCLLAAVDGAVDPAYPRYFADFASIRLGLARYRRALATSAGSVRLTYFGNLVWDGTRLRDQPKPSPARDLSSFARYRGFLESSLQRLATNLAATDRRRPYALLGTISSGYDSPTVAALARDAGLEDAITFDRSTRGEPDSGAAIAAALGIRLSVVPHDAWRVTALPEIPFVASDAKGEDVYFKGAEAALAGRVLLTGFHGDLVWGRGFTPRGFDIVRGDQSGLSLSEYRLGVGFLHCPVPFLGVRQIAETQRISRSREMTPWDVDAGYSRPICRRILETAGVPREAFGMRKQTASVLFFERGDFLSPPSLADFHSWLERHMPGAGEAAPGLWQAPARAAGRLLDEAARLSPHRLRLLQSLGTRIGARGRREPLFRYLFPWALERARQRYGSLPAPRARPEPRPPVGIVDG